jgi:hypothetical protein
MAKWPVNTWFKSAVLREEVSIIRSARSRSLATTSGSSLIPSMPDGLGRADVVVSSPYSAVRAARHPTCTTTAGHHGPSIAGSGGTTNALSARSRGAGLKRILGWARQRGRSERYNFREQLGAIALSDSLRKPPPLLILQDRNRSGFPPRLLYVIHPKSVLTQRRVSENDR